MMMIEMRAFVAASLLFGLCSPLAAQVPMPPSAPPTADRASIAECLRQQAGAPTACIGAVAVACVATAGVDRRAAETGCARREEAIWRERLNQGLQQSARALDAGQRSRLVSVHLAWESYVAQKCALHGATQPAVLQAGRQAGCELREVATRALELQRAVSRPAQRRPSQPPQIIR